MIIDELLSDSFVHSFEWVEGSLEVFIKVVGGFDNFVHDLKSLILGDSWSEWVIGQVSSNSNSSRNDHGGFIFSEFSVGQTFGLHFRLMLGVNSVLMVLFNDLIEELVEALVRVVRTGIASDSRVKVLNSREDTGFKSDTSGILFILVFVPKLLS